MIIMKITTGFYACIYLCISYTLYILKVQAKKTSIPALTSRPRALHYGENLMNVCRKKKDGEANKTNKTYLT